MIQYSIGIVNTEQTDFDISPRILVIKFIFLGALSERFSML